MPQPEQITLEVRIDALGIHFYSLRKTGEALRRLSEQLPGGERGSADAELDAVLAASPRTALVTVTHWDDQGTRASSDLVLAEHDAQLHAFLRDPEQPKRLVAQALDDDELRTVIERLLARPAT
jgi:hypothetical protein